MPSKNGFIIEAKGENILQNIDAILSYVYEYHSSFNEGYCIVRRGNRYGIVNLCLELRVPTIYEAIEEVTETYAVARYDGKYHYIAMEEYGNPYRIPMEFDNARRICNGIGVVTVNGKKGLFSVKSGTLVLPCEYDSILDFSLNRSYTFVQKDGLWGLVNKSGEIFVKPTFEKVDTCQARAWIGKNEYRIASDGKYKIIEE